MGEMPALAIASSVNLGYRAPAPACFPSSPATRPNSTCLGSLGSGTRTTCPRHTRVCLWITSLICPQSAAAY
eukprot:11449368-Alexandrium_andersonii.AAC.1